VIKLVYIIKDLKKKRIQTRAVEEIIERNTRSYDDIVRKSREKEKLLKEAGLEMLKKIEVRNPTDLDVAGRIVGEEVAKEISEMAKAKKDNCIDIQINPKNYQDVKIGGYRKI